MTEVSAEPRTQRETQGPAGKQKLSHAPRPTDWHRLRDCRGVWHFWGGRRWENAPKRLRDHMPGCRGNWLWSIPTSTRGLKFVRTDRDDDPGPAPRPGERPPA